MRVYLASPLGFAASTTAFMRELQAALAGDAVAVLNPWDADYGADFAAAERIADRAERLARLREINTAIAQANERMIEESDTLVAVLDGVDVDSGTASEMGFAYARGKRVFGLRTDSRLTGDNEAAVVNLQVRHWIDASGGSLHTRVADLVAAVRALAGA